MSVLKCFHDPGSCMISMFDTAWNLPSINAGKLCSSPQGLPIELLLLSLGLSAWNRRQSDQQCKKNLILITCQSLLLYKIMMQKSFEYIVWNSQLLPWPWLMHYIHIHVWYRVLPPKPKLHVTRLPNNPSRAAVISEPHSLSANRLQQPQQPQSTFQLHLSTPLLSW